MKIFLYTIVLCLSVPLSSQDTSNALFSRKFYISISQFRTQGREKNPEEKVATKASGIAEPIFFSFSWYRRTPELQTDLEMDSFTVSDGRILALPGKNAYIGILAKGFLWGLGRKMDPVSFPAWSFWKDGVEGVFVETSDSPIRIRFDLLDLYRGFPLRENSWLALEGREKYLPPKAAQELLSDAESKSESSSRYRAGIQIYGQKENSWIYHFRVRYLSLGNWGRYGQETKESRNGIADGDKDYLTEWKIGLGYIGDHFYLSLDAFLTRGLDKTAANPNRPEKSLPISGEAFRFDTGFYFLKGGLSIYGFLPNGERRNSKGEILELGYVGMGAPPIENLILNQVWGVYPGAWVTSQGLERDETGYPGKKPAGLMGVRGDWKESGIRFGVHFTYIDVFHTSESSGNWTVSKRILGNSFVREIGGNLTWSPESDPNSFLRLDIGGIESDEKAGIKQWYFFLQMGGHWE